MSFSAIILAGGRSSRMGRDKAFLEFEGRPLLARQIELARAAGADEILVSGSPNVDYPFNEVRVVTDNFIDAGPLAGIHAGLLAARHPLLLVLAVDMPGMTADLLRGLASKTAANHGVIPRLNGEPEPLAAVYPATARPVVEAQLLANRRSARGFAEACVSAGLAVFEDLAESQKHLFMNLNCPGDLPPAAR